MPIQHILLVDDSKTELHFLSELLIRRGFTVSTAEGGDEAMRRLAEQRPDLILPMASSSPAPSPATPATPTSR